MKPIQFLLGSLIALLTVTASAETVRFTAIAPLTIPEGQPSLVLGFDEEAYCAISFEVSKYPRPIGQDSKFDLDLIPTRDNVEGLSREDMKMYLGIMAGGGGAVLPAEIQTTAQFIEFAKTLIAGGLRLEDIMDLDVRVTTEFNITSVVTQKVYKLTCRHAPNAEMNADRMIDIIQNGGVLKIDNHL